MKRNNKSNNNNFTTQNKLGHQPNYAKTNEYKQRLTHTHTTEASKTFQNKKKKKRTTIAKKTKTIEKENAVKNYEKYFPTFSLYFSKCFDNNTYPSLFNKLIKYSFSSFFV